MDTYRKIAICFGIIGFLGFLLIIVPEWGVFLKNQLEVGVAMIIISFIVVAAIGLILIVKNDKNG